jgi:Zn-dependent oligopeptidase
MTGKLVIARQRLSRQLSFDSFAHKSLSRKVIKSPQHVQDLLLETARCVAHQGETETDLLKSVKSSLQESSAVHVAVAGGKRSATASGGVSGTRSSRKVNNRIYTGKRYSKQTSDLNSTEELDSVNIFPWDESFLINSYKSITSADKAPSSHSHSHSHSHSQEELGEYLSVSSCMNGLRYVCASVFGIEMKTEQVSSVESWTGSGDREFDLMKCSFTGPNGESLGYIYFDLFARPNKFTGAAHFTVTCGCTNTLAVSKNSIQGLQSSDEQQLPVVALVFNFPRDANLSMQALETFYHEVGHAMHSLLSRTKFQHLSGTRGSTDFVEV